MYCSCWGNYMTPKFSNFRRGGRIPVPSPLNETLYMCVHVRCGSVIWYIWELCELLSSCTSKRHELMSLQHDPNDRDAAHIWSPDTNDFLTITNKLQWTWSPLEKIWYVKEKLDERKLVFHVARLIMMVMCLVSQWFYQPSTHIHVCTYTQTCAHIHTTYIHT